MRIAVFPGSFDPLTIGHTDIIGRGLPLFDRIVVAIGVNSQKKYLFDLNTRLQYIEKVYQHEPRITAMQYEGLTVDFCRKIGASFLLRGIRSSIDFEYERTIAQLNQTLAPEIETIFLASMPQYSHVSSSIVREILTHRGDASALLPAKL